ncbi:MAG: preprotein translocase subunit YajC [Pseudomonadota bacterium]
MWITPAFAQDAAAGGPPAWTNFIFIAGFVAIFYFLIIRPQQQQVKKHREMVSAVRRGDTVVTSGGIVGKVTKVLDDNEVQVEIAEGVSVKVVKATLSDVRSRTQPANENDKSEKKD